MTGPDIVIQQVIQTDFSVAEILLRILIVRKALSEVGKRAKPPLNYHRIDLRRFGYVIN